MSAAAILVIVVAAAEAGDASTAVMLGAAAESLGPGVAVRLLAVEDPARVDPVEVERDLQAGAVVTLVWRDAARLRARLRLHVAADRRSTTRDLEFAREDTRAERARTLGLTAASMWPEIAPVSRPAGAPPAAAPPTAPGPTAPPLAPAPRPEARPTTTSSAAPAPGPGPTPTTRAVRNPGAETAVTSPVAATQAPPPEVSSGARRPAVGVSALAAASQWRGGGWELGGRLEGALPVAPSWSLRVGLSLRARSIPELAGTAWIGGLAGGVEWWPAAGRLGRRMSLGLRADALVVRQQVRGSAMPGLDENRGRFLPAADLMAQLAVRAGHRVELLVAAGGEASLGTTTIRRGAPPAPVATLPALRVSAEIGVRVGF